MKRSLMKVSRKIRYIIYCINSYIRIIKSKKYSKKIFLMGIPRYGNLGDQAITLAERKLLLDNFSDYKVIEIESKFVRKNIKFLKKYVDNSLILVNGGGFIGSLWIDEEIMVRKIVNNFTNNKIIILPHTLLYENTIDGNKEFEISKSIFKKHPNLYICAREKITYDFLKKELPDCKAYLFPDMVLYLNRLTKNCNKNKKVLVCLRSDKEKTIDSNIDLNDVLLKYGYKDIVYTDTVIFNNVYEKNREKVILKFLEYINNFDLMITDRLHGMIFSYLAKTPCLVIKSKSHKIQGVYEWIKNDSDVKILSNIENIEDYLKVINNNEKDCSSLIDYTDLINLISNNL